MKKKVITLLLSVAVVFSSFNMTPAKAEASSNPFNDIKGHWAEADIIQGYKDGLINGFDDGTFRPNDIVTGDQFLTMMYRSFSDGGGKFKSEFLDQVKGYSLYSYNNLMNAIGEISFDFQNAPKGYWAKPFIDLAVKSELTTFNKKYFDYEDANAYKRQIKREDAAYLVSQWTKHYEYDYETSYRIYLASSNLLVKDMNMFSHQNESHGVVDSMLSGIMQGYPDSKFYPQRYITRAEAITVIQRLKNTKKRTPVLPKPVNKYFIERLDNKGIVMMHDKVSKDTFISMRNILMEDGYLFEYFNLLLWFENKNRMDDLTYSLSMGYGFQSGKNADINFATTSDNKMVLKINYMFDLSKKNNSEMLNSALKVISGKSDVNKLRTSINDYLDNPKSGKFIVDGISYEVKSNIDNLQVSKVY